MSGRRKGGREPRMKRGNCNKPYRETRRETNCNNDKWGSESSSQPPDGLKGKALGMWYRDRQINKSKKEEEDRVPEIILHRQTFEEIENFLVKVGGVGNIDETPMADGEFKKVFLEKVNGSFEENLAKHAGFLEMKPDPKLDAELKKQLLKKQSCDTQYQTMEEFRVKLPCFKKKDKILRNIDKNQVVVITGETGCGKTTQVVQYVLDDYILKGNGSQCNIVCTQPRRISAISVAERVAAERNESLGDSIGYHIRLEKISPKRQSGTVTFVTTGVLLKWLQSNPTLSGFSHVFLDEVHEREIQCDFAVTCLKQIITKRPCLKLILMSATLKFETISKYFNGAPNVFIPGFTFPVEEIYLDRILQMTKFKFRDANERLKPTAKNNDFLGVILPYIKDMEKTHQISKDVATQLRLPASEVINFELIARLIHYICLNEKDGAILVFVPGISEIRSVEYQLRNIHFFNANQCIIINLHSTLPTVNQKKIFNRPPAGVRKIIIATNIAETSITIDDVVFVIDCGFMKMKDFSMDLNVSTLTSRWVTLANAHQRRGRAGRVEAGKCYKLYTRAREMLLDQYPLPEMQRTQLEEVVLQVKMLQLGKAESFLQTVMDPPDKKAIQLAIEMLHNLNALDAEERLTPLGFHLAKLPLDPQTGKMILMSAIFSCVDPILSIAAAIVFKDPFYTPLGKESIVHHKKVELVHGGCEKSDHFVFSAAMQNWEAALGRQEGMQFVRENFLSVSTLYLLRDLKVQFASYLHEMNFLKSADPKDLNGNVNSDNVELVRAIICSGLYPNVAMIKSIKKQGLRQVVLMKTAEHPRVELHRRSICINIPQFESPFFVYHMMLKSSAIFIHDATMVSPWALLFFGRKLDIVECNDKHAVRVDDLIKVKCSKKTGMLIKKLRQQLDWLLACAISNPEVVDWGAKTKQSLVLKAISKVISGGNHGVGLDLNN